MEVENNGTQPTANSRGKTDPAWNYCEELKENGKSGLKYLCCGKVYKGGGIHRIKEHLAGKTGQVAGCKQVTPEIRAEMKVSLGVSDKKNAMKRTLRNYDENPFA
ncbi:hAT transposon superfamily [Euphorbia peplus]|nr:hAT transposon superfamily [Euphorbia peplus]